MAWTPFTTETGTAEAAILGEYWDSNVLDNLWPELFYYQFAQKRMLPGGVGKTIHFTRFTKFADNKMSELSEVSDDVLSPSLMSATEISATVSQYGFGVLFSDFVLLTSRFNLIDEALEHLGMEAGRFVDSNLVDTHVAGNGFGRVAGSLDTSVASVTSAVTLTITDLEWASSKMAHMPSGRVRKFPTSAYVGIGPAAAFHHVKSGVSGGWFELNKYTNQNVRELKAWSIGRVANIDCFEADNSISVLSDFSNLQTGLYISDDAAGAYVTRIFGPGAYGAVNLEGGAVSTYVKKLGSAGWRDLVNQRAGVGIKLFFGGKDLDCANRMIELYSGQTGLFE